MSENKNTSGGNAEVSQGLAENVWTVGAVMLVVGLVGGFFIGRYWQTVKPLVDSDQVNVATSTESTSSSLTSSGAVFAPTNTYKTINSSSSVSVDDQRAGSLVFIKHAEVSEPTWITIREIVDGSIGNILGAEMVTSPTDDVPVTLLRATVAGKKYAIFLYQDDGNGQFDFKKDFLVMQGQAPVAAMFTAE